MVRRLQIHELAIEAGSSVELIERFTEIGILKVQPDGSYGAGDLIRLEAMNAFLSAGVGLDQLGAALSEGVFTFDYLDRFHPEPTPTTGRTMLELARELEVTPALVKAIYLAMGLPEPEPDKPMREDEEHLISEFLKAWKIGADEQTYIRAARLIGEPARQVSEGWTRLFVEKVSDPLVERDITADERIATIVESTEALTRLAPPLLLWLFQRHLRNAIDRANIEGLERELVARGLSLPTPDRPPAISFVDLSGYTTLTEAIGDELATNAADRLRELAGFAARSHRGKVVKLLGDGAMLHFERVDDALAGVLELVAKLGATGLTAHAGIHAGPVMEHDQDYFGRTVNLASRVAGVAEPGHVVVTKAVKSAAEDQRYRFDVLPQVSMKGIGEPVDLYRAVLISP
jgi:adenylate cyclase